MWTQVQKMLNGNDDASPRPAAPVRQPQPAFDALTVGKIISFSASCPLAPLAGASAVVVAVRRYRFGADEVKSYQLQLGKERHYFLTVAEDDMGKYLGISRQLSEAEQDSWFGHDALGFFTEASSAKSIRCKADMEAEGAWAAGRYAKTVDWVEGIVAPNESPRLAHSIHYSLLVNETGDKAFEIEHEDTSGENRFFITVYRPVEDIASIEAARPPAPTPPQVAAPSLAANDDVPLFKEPQLTTPIAHPKQRLDFRRLDESLPEIHIERTPPSLNEEDSLDLPAFLLQREERPYLSLDAVLPPEAERVRVGIGAARGLIDTALRKNVRVRDVLREMLGLESAISDEVIFEMPLTDADYRTLAMRYKLRPDHRLEIRARLEEELRQKVTGIAKV